MTVQYSFLLGTDVYSVEGASREVCAEKAARLLVEIATGDVNWVLLVPHHDRREDFVAGESYFLSKVGGAVVASRTFGIPPKVFR
jgi:hypothetical protein